MIAVLQGALEILFLDTIHDNQAHATGDVQVGDEVGDGMAPGQCHRGLAPFTARWEVLAQD